MTKAMVIGAWAKTPSPAKPSAAEQEPGDPRPELAPAQAPFADRIQAGAFPVRGEETEHGDEGEKDDEYDRRNDVEVLEHRFSSAARGRRRRGRAPKPGSAGA